MADFSHHGLIWATVAAREFLLTRAASPPIRTLILADVYARYAFAFFSRADGKSPVAGSAADILKAGVVIHQYCERAVCIGFDGGQKHQNRLRAAPS